MPSRPHHPLARARSRRRPRPIDFEGVSCLFWAPPPGAEPIILANVGDAIGFVFGLFELPMEDAALLLLDARRRLVGVILDPPPDIDCVTEWAQSTGGVAEFCQMILVVVEGDIADGPPRERESRVFEAIGQQALEHNVLLLDMIFANPDKVRSMAYATDPSCVWTEPFDQ